MKGDKRWLNTYTEVEDLGGRNRAASISVGHRVFFDKADGNKAKRHKLTDERPAKDCVVIQSAQCCVEVYPYYSRYYDVQHEQVRLHEERWVVERWRAPPGKWQDVGAWNPIMTVEETAECITATVTYDTDYGILTVEYFQRDENALKHNVTFKNTSGSAETFRVVQAWSGIVGAKVNGKDTPIVEDALYFAFHSADKPAKKFNIAENLWGMQQYLQRPVGVETHAQGMKADFVYAQWVLANGESLVIDPDTVSLDNPTEDGHIMLTAGPTYFRDNTLDTVYFGGFGNGGWQWDRRGYVEWDISSLFGATLDANPFFKYHGFQNLATDEEINPLTEEAPSGATDANLYGYIATGVAYVNPWGFVAAANQSVDLGAAAKADLQAAMDASQAWFAIGCQSPADEGGLANLESAFISEDKTDAATPKPTLFVTYTPGGWTGKIAGVTDPAKVAGVDVANIEKIKGVA